MANQVIDVVFEFGAAHLEFFDFLVGRELNFLFDAIHGVVEPMIFIELFPEMLIRAFQAADDFAMFRKLSEDGVMKVHSIRM